MAKERSLFLGAVTGALGGAIGTVVLNVIQAASLNATRAAEKGLGRDTKATREQEQLGGIYKQAHIAVAEDLAQAAGTTLSPQQREAAAPVVEFAFGMTCAAVYGALAEYLPPITAGYGSLFGASLFFAAAEAVLPALHYAPSIPGRTAVQHAGGLSGNIAYGVTTEFIRRALRP